MGTTLRAKNTARREPIYWKGPGLQRGIIQLLRSAQTT